MDPSSLSGLQGEPIRLHISLPERVLRHFDFAAEKSCEMRSGFISRIPLEEL